VASANLLLHKKNVFSQNGEDGIIDCLLERLGSLTEGACCEFGAWDGVHLSNTRRLSLRGWTTILIEGDETRFAKLKPNVANSPNVFPLNEYVDDGQNSLSELFLRYHLGQYSNALDFLSIDVDGLDYYLFERLDLKPKIICIEVNAGHSPDSTDLLDREIARNNVGQPLGCFVEIGRKLGYELVCYTANAFFVREDLCKRFAISPLPAAIAYEQFLNSLTPLEREWLYAVNLGLVAPFFCFQNRMLSAERLGIGRVRRSLIRAKHASIRRLAEIRRTGKPQK
jgi:hypothetical protein